MMRKIIIVAFLLLSFLQIKAQQTDTEKKNITKLGVPSFVFGSLFLSYERVFTDKITGQMNFFFFGRKSNPSPYGPNRGWGITPEVRFYLSETKTAPVGFFLAPFMTLQGLTYDYAISEKENPELFGRAGVVQVSEAKSTVFGIGATVGYQWVFKDIITLDVYGGPGFGLASMKTTTGDATHTSDVIRKEVDASFPFVKQSGPIFRAGVSLGVIF
jgi:hypothetical protein